MADETFGNYQLLKRIATGGMAQIFLARQQGLEGFEKLLVVKRILPHLAENEEFVRMFLDEARIAARLNHPNIVQIFNLGSQDDSYFIAMEYIHGEDVRRVWKRADQVGKKIPVPLVCRIIMEACGGLHYAHKKTDATGKSLGIVHRDISPQNIIVTFEGGVKVVDFGIAKAVNKANVTRSGVLKGKYAYMSPEQAAGKRIDARSDIFALGIILYELATGTRLFKRGNEVQTLNAVIECDVPRPSKVNPELPADFDSIVLRALAKDPDKRYPEAIQLQMALEDWLIAHQLPSSSAHLAAFMQSLYAERLAREAQEGQVVIEEAPQRPSPSLRSNSASSLAQPVGPESTTPWRGKKSSAAAEGEPTTIDVPGSGQRYIAPAAPVIPFELTGAGLHQKRRLQQWLLFGAAGLAVIVLFAGGFLLLRGKRMTAPPPALVHVKSEPPGARMTLDDALLSSVTPSPLPPVKKGTHTLVLSKEGFVDYRLEVDVPETGEVQLPVVNLEAIVVPPAVPTRLRLTLRTEPSGADLYVDGNLQGKTTAVLEVEPGTPLPIRLELPGFATEERIVQVGEGLSQTEFVVLKADTSVRKPSLDKKGRVTGTVRFAVTPWASVSCGTYKFGKTPFPDQQIPAGVYECTFENPAFGIRKQKVEVRPNALTRTVVRF